jgi:hypothetical protein
VEQSGEQRRGQNHNRENHSGYGDGFFAPVEELAWRKAGVLVFGHGL